MKIAGVYKITNNITGEFYIGSSKDIEKRWREHRSPSVHKQRPNSKLYKSMASYGLDNFTIEVIEKTDNLKEREQYFIDILKPSYNNIRANGIDIKRKEETTRRCSKAYHQAHRDECLAKMKDWHKAHRDKELAKNKDYYYTHRDEQLAKSKAYRQAHRDEQLAKIKDYNNRLCLYEGETLTLAALSRRFFRQGIANPYKEAKEYLL